MRKFIILLVAAALAGGCHTPSPSGSSAQVHAGEEHPDHGNDHSGHSHDEQEYDHDGDRDGNDHIDGIVFSRQQAEMAGLTVLRVASGTFNQVIKTSGQVRAAQGDEITIVATTGGTVSFANSSITEGTAVKQGETLVTISARNLQEGDPVIRTKAEYDAAEKEIKRAGNLIRDKIISAKEYEQIQLRYESAKTAWEAVAAQSAPNGVKVVSPMHGYLKNRLVSQGEYVAVGQPIATIAQNKRLQLRAEVSEKNFRDLHSITGANFKLSYDPAIHKLTELNGRLISSGKASAPSSFYVPVTFEFDNIGTIIPGSYAEIYLLAQPRTDVISIPVSAVTEEQGLYFVYLQTGDETYQKQEVTLGQDDGSRIQVLSGLKNGDIIVTQGVYQVKLAASSGVIPEGHSHTH